MKQPTTCNAWVFRIAVLFWLVGWYWKVAYTWPQLLGEAFAYPIDAAAFQTWLEHPIVSAIAWLTPIGAVAAFIWPRAIAMRIASIGMAVCAYVLCIHLETCNDATYVTSFWAAVWLTWFSFNAHRDDPALVVHARTLAVCVIALMFLGGAIGKLTSDYFSGEAFYHIYFLHKPNFPYPWLRDALSPETLRSTATWFSNIAIAGELAMVSLPLLPFRVAVIVGVAIALGMVVISTHLLFSVMACLIGLLLATRHLTSEQV